MKRYTLYTLNYMHNNIPIKMFSHEPILVCVNNIWKSFTLTLTNWVVCFPENLLTLAVAPLCIQYRKEMLLLTQSVLWHKRVAVSKEQVGIGSFIKRIKLEALFSPLKSSNEQHKWKANSQRVSSSVVFNHG